MHAQVETTRDSREVGKSNFDVQKGPYINTLDGLGVVPTYTTAMVEAALLARDPTEPPFQNVHVHDVCFITTFDENVQAGAGNTTYTSPPGNKQATRMCAVSSVLPSLVNPEKPGALSQGVFQFDALR